MTCVYLIAGILFFLASFIAHKYFIQFIVAGVFLFVLFLMNKNTKELNDLKKTIEAHNDLMKQDMEELKKSRQ